MYNHYAIEEKSVAQYGKNDIINKVLMECKESCQSIVEKGLESIV